MSVLYELTPHGLRVGAIEVRVEMVDGRGYAAVKVSVGRSEIVIAATPKGQKASLLIEDDRRLFAIQARRAGRWVVVE